MKVCGSGSTWEAAGPEGDSRAPTHRSLNVWSSIEKGTHATVCCRPRRPTFWQYFFSRSFSSLPFSSCRAARAACRAVRQQQAGVSRAATCYNHDSSTPQHNCSAPAGSLLTRPVDLAPPSPTCCRSVHRRCGPSGVAGGNVSDCSWALRDAYSARVAAAVEGEEDCSGGAKCKMRSMAGHGGPPHENAQPPAAASER